MQAVLFDCINPKSRNFMSSGFVLDCFPKTRKTGRPGFWTTSTHETSTNHAQRGFEARAARDSFRPPERRRAAVSGFPMRSSDCAIVHDYNNSRQWFGWLYRGWRRRADRERNQPHDVALDFSGNIYIADVSNARVRKVSSGIISTLAGNGTVAYAGDGVPATSAELDLPEGVAADSGGNVYIADSGGSSLTTGSPLTGGVVRKVTAGGTISSVAGYGTAGYYGDGGPAIMCSSASLPECSPIHPATFTSWTPARQPDPQSGFEREHHDSRRQQRPRVFGRRSFGDCHFAQPAARMALDDQPAICTSRTHSIRGSAWYPLPASSRRLQEPVPLGLFGRRRPRHRRSALVSFRNRGGCGPKRLHSRYDKQPDSRDFGGRHDHDRGGQRRQRVWIGRSRGHEHLPRISARNRVTLTGTYT